jgi:hypothetical protein
MFEEARDQFRQGLKIKHMFSKILIDTNSEGQPQIAISTPTRGPIEDLRDKTTIRFCESILLEPELIRRTGFCIATANGPIHNDGLNHIVVSQIQYPYALGITLAREYGMEYLDRLIEGLIAAKNDHVPSESPKASQP